MATDSNAGISLIEEEESALNASINTTPLVDIMLVMLIIFLITVPVAVSIVEVELPEERNLVVQTRPENVNISVVADGTVYVNTVRVSEEELATRLARAARPPGGGAPPAGWVQPEVHIRGDLLTEYYHVGRVVEAAQKAGILKIGFITKAPPQGYRQ
jgi:biopolymer transport protein ExbD